MWGRRGGSWSSSDRRGARGGGGNGPNTNRSGETGECGPGTVRAQVRLGSSLGGPARRRRPPGRNRWLAPSRSLKYEVPGLTEHHRGGLGASRNLTKDDSLGHSRY
jgi:hypothetical protein